jgi:hypothetical protein
MLIISTVELIFSWDELNLKLAGHQKSIHHADWSKRLLQRKKAL